jgi:hypothetical protein
MRTRRARDPVQLYALNSLGSGSRGAPEGLTRGGKRFVCKAAKSRRFGLIPRV